MIYLKFPFEQKLREDFRAGSLGTRWADQYPQLFDDHDRALLTTAHQRKYHFFEWLGAILLYESTGFVSLVQKYTCRNHPRKVAEVRRILPTDLCKLLLDPDASGAPDLLAYSMHQPDRWFFCEIKGPSDSVRPHQEDGSGRLAKLSGRETFLLEFVKLN